MESTLNEFLQSQQALVDEAALALPHQFSRCTYALGPLRQAVYLCLTCPENRAICSACSIACHTNHEQVELFPKRNFRCDCPTTAISNQCTLHTKLEDENTTNVYGQNFKGSFCRCGRPYDAKTERETMIQCLVCEDWYHESCCNLRERPSSREPTPVATEPQEDNASEASSSGLPPPLISGEDYESFVCAACAFDLELVQQYAGTPGAIIVVRNSINDPWRIEQGLQVHTENDPVEVIQQSTSPPPSPTVTGSKRPHSPSELSSGESKRAKTSCETVACLAPPINPVADKIYTGGLEAALNSSTSLGTGDIFFMDGFRDRWCRCSTCLPSLQARPYLLEEEDTYEPPEDPDSGLSLEELGMRALERIPRDRAIDGIHAFQAMRDDLIKFLRPFAQEGKVVNESDVRAFFDSLESKKPQM
ncbi:hypothetical protein Agabi119p4_10930 [Agaricus bisporus var. burnettii]|uniref:UBR-type domain-containing protein n=1 Tax=Agaricus bisporus var. burnettii TaxID=192524 RepID=A0A8H7EVN1_AGABI|nr:hypothetical protein Agabi119p4_10930 [Agaricus bisporus var. burnettii]